MNEEERNDLLVRLAVNQEAIEKTIAANHDTIEKRLANIEGKLYLRMCDTHKEKILTLERITWTALFAGITALTTDISAVIKSIAGAISK